jgi:hypothetical protein
LQIREQSHRATMRLFDGPLRFIAYESPHSALRYV